MKGCATPWDKEIDEMPGAEDELNEEPSLRLGRGSHNTSAANAMISNIQPKSADEKRRSLPGGPRQGSRGSPDTL